MSIIEILKEDYEQNTYNFLKKIPRAMGVSPFERRTLGTQIHLKTKLYETLLGKSNRSKAEKEVLLPQKVFFEELHLFTTLFRKR